MHSWRKFPHRRHSSHRSRRSHGFGRRDSGFTLTELAIAMVVLGVIASIAIPSYLGSRNNSYDKEAQTSIENVLRASKFHYQSQGDFSDASSAQCGDSKALATDLQKLESGIDVVASSVSSTNSRIVSVQAVQTWDSTGGLLGCQGFYAVALSSSGSCWAARIILEGKYLASGSVSPVVVNTQTNTSNNAITSWSALAVNGNAFGVLKPQTSAADGDNTNGLVAIKTACKAKTQSTGVATTSSNYIAPSQFYSSWRDTAPAVVIPVSNCLTTGACSPGETGPGGGTVFYASTSTFTSVGSDCNTSCKYLEYAPIGWSVEVGQTNVQCSGSAAQFYGTATVDPSCKWSGSSANVSGATGTAIGSGYANTSAIIAVSNAAGYAATSSRAYQGGGKTDWFLPSLYELKQLCRYASSDPVNITATTCAYTSSIRTGFRSSTYWSSTQGSVSSQAFFVYFGTGGPWPEDGKTAEFPTRPVRAFG